MAWYLCWKTGNGGLSYDEELHEFPDDWSEDTIAEELEGMAGCQPSGYRGCSFKKIDLEEASAKLLSSEIRTAEAHIAGISYWRKRRRELKKACVERKRRNAKLRQYSLLSFTHDLKALKRLLEDYVYVSSLRIENGEFVVHGSCNSKRAFAFTDKIDKVIRWLLRERCKDRKRHQEWLAKQESEK